MDMPLHAILGLEPHAGAIAFCGSGGKSSLCYALAMESLQIGERAAVTTTTHIEKPVQAPLCLLEGHNRETLQTLWNRGLLPVCGALTGEQKLCFGGKEQWDMLLSACDSLFVEADGSRRLPVKYPNTTEPVLLPEMKQLFVVQGLSGLHKKGEQVCHRWELAKTRFPNISHTLTPETAALLLWEGYGAYAPTFILNQADTPALVKEGESIARMLYAKGAKRVILLSLKNRGLQKETLLYGQGAL